MGGIKPSLWSVATINALKTRLGIPQLNTNQAAAVTGAASPSASNVFATMQDALNIGGINPQTGTTYVLVLADAGKYVRCANANPIALTVPKNSVVAFPINTIITIGQSGEGQITVAPIDGDVTINAYQTGLKTAGQYASLQLIKVATDTWDLIGGVA